MFMNATFLLRLKAFIIDYFLILAYLFVIFVVNIFLFPSLQNLFAGSLIVAQLTGFFMVTLPISLYFIISDSKIGRQSYGKKKTGIQVVDNAGAALSLKQITLRTVIKFLPWELSHFLVYRLVYIADGEVPILYYIIGGLIYSLMIAYILSAIFTKKKQSVYDLIAKTQVVKLKDR